MPARTSKEVTDRQKTTRFLLQAFKLQGPRVARQLLAIVRPHLLEGDDEPGFLAAIVALARRLEAVLERLVTVDERIYALNALLARLREERDDKTPAVGQVIVRLRQTLSAQYVAPRLELLGFEGKTARKPIPVLRQADRLCEALPDGGLEEILGEPFFAHSLDLRPQVEELGPVADELRGILQAIDDTRREIALAVVEKGEIMQEHDRLHVRTARAFESLCRIAGEGELADRVRPAGGRPDGRRSAAGRPRPGAGNFVNGLTATAP